MNLQTKPLASLKNFQGHASDKLEEAVAIDDKKAIAIWEEIWRDVIEEIKSREVEPKIRFTLRQVVESNCPEEEGQRFGTFDTFTLAAEFQTKLWEEKEIETYIGKVYPI